MYNIVSINVNGLRGFNKRAAIFNWIKEKRFDFALLQETHCKNDFEAKQWGKLWNGKCFWNHGSSASKGVAILVSKKLTNVTRINLNTDLGSNDIIGRFISVECQLEENNAYTISNVYTPNDPIGRKSYFVKLSKMFDSLSASNHIIGGDYNCVMNINLDRQFANTNTSTHVTHDEGSRELSHFLSKHNLEDIWRRRNPSVKLFSFARNNSKSRIDLFLTSNAIDNEIENCNITKFPFSDHCAITLQLITNNITRGPGTWKLNTSILENEQYIEMIECFWRTWVKQKNNFKDLRQWWDMTKFHIKSLTIDFCHCLNKQGINISVLEKELDSLMSNSSAGNQEQIQNLMTKIANYYDNKAKAAMIRSRAQHILENEKSTSYFFNLEWKTKNYGQKY